MLNKYLPLFLLFIFSLPSVLSLFQPGFFLSDDGEWMIIRFSAFHQALADGQFPPRFLGRLNFGYGYPVANFLYPGFMYLAEVPKLLGFGFVDSIKIVLGFSMIASAVFAYFWLLRLFDKFSALAGSLFYLYTPYHLFDLYKRGSVGEVLTLAVIPFILWQFERKSFFWMTAGIALLILSHNTLAVLFLPIIFVYGLLQKKFSIIVFLLSFFVGFLLSAFFWLPAIFELQYTVFSQTRVSEWQNYFSPLNLIGPSTLVVFLLSAFIFCFSKSSYRTKTAILFFTIGIVSLFLSTSISNFVWRIMPVSFVQFPFRLLSLGVLSSAFLAALIVYYFKDKVKIGASLILLGLLGLSAVPYIQPTVFFDKGEGYYATNEATTTVQDEYMPRWVREKPKERFQSKVEIVEGKGRTDNVSYSSSRRISFLVLANEKVKARVNTVYYPGWKAFIDGKEQAIDYNNKKGVIEVEVLGQKNVEVVFVETGFRLFANLLAFSSFTLLILFSLKRFRRSS